MKDKLNIVEVGKRIKSTRENLDLSREQFAERVPMSKSFLEDVECGIKCLSLYKFYDVAATLGVSTDYLLMLKEEPETEDEERRLIFARIMEAMSGCDAATMRDIENMIRAFTHALNREKSKE